MKIFNIPLSHPFSYWLIAVIGSVYHGIRGYLIQRLYIGRLNETPTERTWTEKIIVYFTYGFVSNFVLSLFGFASLYAVCEIIDTIADLSKIETGTAIFLSFLSLVALAGIAGIYPLWDKLFRNFRN
jgi:ABC-type multidrug transport system permease subunit